MKDVYAFPTFPSLLSGEIFPLGGSGGGGGNGMPG